MKIETTSSQLILAIESSKERETLEDIKDRVGHDDVRFLSDMLDEFGLLGNGVLYPILPEHVGALTQAPMLSDDVEYPDDGDTIARGQVWWYPRYEIEDFSDVLLATGRVAFDRASVQV
ncbi:hypothetical protein [Paraburkholderia sp. J8-2]|uniref:hypothetical protein n=1 Tax=Paraburkholderia sp. J8-2 TaxID=2805440 RepID=UPI002AB60E2D|nr:hypothetical protein [Paraburkholderia sp. J8-2]